MNHVRNANTLFTRIAGATLAAVFLASPTLAQSSATKVDDAVKEEFRELVRRRDQLARKLAAADRKPYQSPTRATSNRVAGSREEVVVVLAGARGSSTQWTAVPPAGSEG